MKVRRAMEVIRYICPVCGDFFLEPNLAHCLRCNHHYPREEDGSCHNCTTLCDDLIDCVPIKMLPHELPYILQWDKRNNWHRGVWQVIR